MNHMHTSFIHSTCTPFNVLTREANFTFTKDFEVQHCCVQVHSDFFRFSTAIRCDEIYKLIGILSGVGAEDYLFACSINFYYL
jgi:hypothetical protein